MKLFDIFKKKNKKPVTKTGNHVVDFYTTHCDEEARLLSKHGQVEFLTTVRYVERYLEEGNRIIEIGAGTGRYSHYFAQKGFEVDAVELVEHNIEVFKSKTKPNEKITIRQGNALDLSEFGDNTYDVTLLLGPMYHLYTVEEQKKALSEAIRVTNTDGYIFVAYCMYDPSIVGQFKRNKMKKLIDMGLFNPETLEAYFTPEGIFKLYTVDEIKKLTVGSPAERIKLISADGYANHMSEAIDAMDDETFDLYLRYHFSACEREDLMGYSHHTLDILRKE